MAARRDARAACPAKPCDAVQAALGVQATNDLRGPSAHRLERCRAVARGGELLDICAAGLGHLPAGHVRLDERFVQHPDVDQDDGDAMFKEAVTQEGVLDAFGIERPDQDDRGTVRAHRRSRPVSSSTRWPSNSVPMRGSVETGNARPPRCDHKAFAHWGLTGGRVRDVPDTALTRG